MKNVVALLCLLLLYACGGPPVPSAYPVTSPASPDFPPATRDPVAAVLTASDPLDARVAGDSVVVPASHSGGHEHHNHGVEKSR